MATVKIADSLGDIHTAFDRAKADPKALEIGGYIDDQFVAYNQHAGFLPLTKKAELQQDPKVFDEIAKALVAADIKDVPDTKKKEIYGALYFAKAASMATGLNETEKAEAVTKIKKKACAGVKDQKVSDAINAAVDNFIKAPAASKEKEGKKTDVMKTLTESVKDLMMANKKDGKNRFTDDDVKAINDKLQAYYKAGGKDMGVLTTTQINAIASYVEKAVKEKEKFSDIDVELVTASAIIGLAKKGQQAKTISQSDVEAITAEVILAKEPTLRSQVAGKNEKEKFEIVEKAAKPVMEAAGKAAGSVERAGTGMRVGASLIGAIAAFIGFKWLFTSKEEVNQETGQPEKKSRSFFSKAMGALMVAAGITAVVAVGMRGGSASQLGEDISHKWRNIVNKSREIKPLQGFQLS